MGKIRKTAGIHLLLRPNPGKTKIFKGAAKVLVTMLLCLLPLSCYYDQGEEFDPVDIAVSFKTDIQPIFNRNCILCHPAINPSPDLSEGNSYQSLLNRNLVKANDLNASALYQRLLGNPSIMPPSGGLPESDINLFRNWIEQGALDN